ncbi:L-2-amino-thiazoline-4-carboxylic acid hydrolase [Chloroflexota bacterium]
MKKSDLLNVIVTKEQFNELRLAKLGVADREYIVKRRTLITAGDLLMMTELLVSAVGKEKAKKMIEEATYNRFCKVGKAIAEKAGNPQDIDGYIETVLVGALGNIPDVPPMEIIERTKNKVVYADRKCFFAEQILELAKDPAILDVVKHRCCHDKAIAHGFNPKLKFEMSKFLLSGDDSCEFIVEL